jgi:hypothetical protein
MTGFCFLGSHKDHVSRKTASGEAVTGNCVRICSRYSGNYVHRETKSYGSRSWSMRGEELCLER